MMRSSAFFSVLLISSSIAAGAQAGPPAPRPNIVIIMADDLGYGDLGCYGHLRYKTPNLDRMAAEGARMTQLNTPMPFCAPTRAALLTGRYPFRCGLTTNPDPESGPATDAIALPPGEVTLAQVLHDAGYATGMVGKWHLGHQKPEYLPTRRGFDEYFGIPYSNDMRPVRLLDGENEVEYPVVQTTITRRYTERALRFIDRNRDRPFFLYFAHAMPHKPLACSEAFYKKSGAGLYGDALAELDWSVGQVLARLKDLGQDERTLVIFTSDNGPWYGGSTGGLRGMKTTTWEGGFRVPCIARWPGRLAAGRVCNELAVTMDLFATALAAAEVARPAGRVIDGQDLLPVMAGTARSPHEVVYGHSGPQIATVRDGRWKLHVLPPRDRRDLPAVGRWVDFRAPDGVTILAPFEQSQPTEYPGLRTGDLTRAMSLFDLEGDPGEQHDVAAKYPEIVARLKARYDVILTEMEPARIELVAGAGTGGEGAPAPTARLNNPFGVGFDTEHSLYFVEMAGNRVRKIGADGRIRTLAGTGRLGQGGDDGPADGAEFNGPHSLAVAPNGDIFIADTWNNRVRKIDAQTGRIMNIAGTGRKGFSGDGGPAVSAEFGGIYCLALDDGRKTIHVADLDNRRVRQIDLKTGIVTTVAGNGKKGVPSDGALAVSAPLVDPRAVAVDERGNLYILERGGHALRVVDRAGKIRTVAGTGKPGNSGDGGPANLARLNGPKHLCVDGEGNVLIADTENHCIRVYRVREGRIERIAGIGRKGTAGLGGLPSLCELNQPHGVTIGPGGILYISDSSNDRILRIIH